MFIPQEVRLGLVYDRPELIPGTLDVCGLPGARECSQHRKFSHGEKTVYMHVHMNRSTLEHDACLGVFSYVLEH